jgi:hypothetical protein
MKEFPMSEATMGQALARLWEAHGPSPEMKRIVVVNNAHSELFDAASVILGWMRGLRAEDRPLAKFNRLQEAINGVREAHQMRPEDVKY